MLNPDFKSRSRSADKLKDNEVYYGDFKTSQRYTMVQLFHGAQLVSCVSGVQCASVKDPQGIKRKGESAEEDKIKIGADAKVKVLLIRRDHGEMIQDKDRYMSTWIDPTKQVDRIYKADRLA